MLTSTMQAPFKNTRTDTEGTVVVSWTYNSNTGEAAGEVSRSNWMGRVWGVEEFTNKGLLGTDCTLVYLQSSPQSLTPLS